MRDRLLIQLAVLSVIAGFGAPVRAQPADRFYRVTTGTGQRNTDARSARLTSVARSGGASAVGRTTAQADVMHPYSSQALSRMQAGSSGVPRYSSQPEPQPVPAQPVSQSRRTYFPGMRAARAMQQPVTLTARASGIPHICTPSRSLMMGGGRR
jgi:hypothetical protein